MSSSWNGVFPAVTTQRHADQSLDFSATVRHFEALIHSGVSGLIVCGLLGENQTLAPGEKRQIERPAVEMAADRLPLLSGVAESRSRLVP